MSRTYDNGKKPSQPTTLFTPTSSILQTRPFGSIQTDLDEDAAPRPSGHNENLLEKLINQPSTESSDPPVQAKPQNRLKMIQAKRMSMIQAKLNIGEPNDKYEQEADATASKVVQQINSPTQDKSVQRESAMEEDDELQMKPISSIQRESTMEEDDELQMKSLVQRRENLGGGEASADLESSIQSARGGGQSLDANLQAKMGQVMGADFSGIRVHTDSQSDQLNKSIQAKAFTTGQDVFFRQGTYNPSSTSGQELIAHELTHVVQQGGASLETNKPVQRKTSKKLNQAKSQQFPITNTQSISLQAAFDKEAYVNDVAQLHTLDSSGKDKGTVRGGKKLKVGESILADETKVNGDWILAKEGATEGYIRRDKIVLKSALNKSNPDLKAKGHLGLLDMVDNAKKISGDKDAWENLEKGIGFLQGIEIAKTVTKSIGGVATAGGAVASFFSHDKTAEVLEKGADYIEPLADSLSTLKNALSAIIGLWRLYNYYSQNEQKGKDALVITEAIFAAASSAADVAATVCELLEANVPMSVASKVPGLNIVLSIISATLRLWDAISSGKTKGKMMDSANTLRQEIASELGERVPDKDNVKQSEIFDGDRRGTFPRWIWYFRTKKTVRKAIKDLATFADGQVKEVDSEQKKLISPKEEELEQPVKDGHAKIKDHIDLTDLGGGIKNSLKTLMGEPKTIAKLLEKVKSFGEIDQKIDTYEYVDKMSEINQKRQVGGWTDAILELVSMAGDIATMTGIGAAIGQGVKIASSGIKAAHGTSKFVEKLYRNRKDGIHKKSKTNKHKEYVAHAKFIYGQISTLTQDTPEGTERAKQLEEYIRATGVNYGIWLAVSKKGEPKEQVEMLVEAMKERK